MWSTLKRIERTQKNGMTWHPLEWTVSMVFMSAQPVTEADKEEEKCKEG